MEDSKRMMARTRMGLGIVECPAVIVGAAVTGVETLNLEAMSVLPETLGDWLRIAWNTPAFARPTRPMRPMRPPLVPFLPDTSDVELQPFFRKWKSEYSPTKLLSCTESAQSAHSDRYGTFSRGFRARFVGRFSPTVAQNWTRKSAHCAADRHVWADLSDFGREREAGGR